MLWPPRSLRTYCVTSDSSLFGLGAVLVQHEDENNEHPIAYASRKLLPRERKFSTFEKETLAVVWALKTFERYIHNRRDRSKLSAVVEHYINSKP